MALARRNPKTPKIDEIRQKLAKLGDGLDESPTVMVVDRKQQLRKNRGILKPSWAFVKTKINDTMPYWSQK